MKLPRRNFLHLAAGAAALPAVSRIARAQSYPSRTVRIVVGFPAGQAIDISARLMAEWLQQRLGQSFIVENRPGAAANVATEMVARSPADGYTLLIISSNNVINTTLYGTVDFAREIAPIATPGPYFVSAPSKISVNRQTHNVDGKSIIDETWDIKGNDGNALDVVVQFERGALTRAKAEAKLHSGAKPEFYRIYKFEQATDVVRSSAMGVDRATKFTIKASGPMFALLFDGTQQVISITSVPYYSRSIYVPTM